MAYKIDIEITPVANKLPIRAMGAKLGIWDRDMVPYGKA